MSDKAEEILNLQVERGRYASELLNNPVLKSFFEKFEKEILRVWENTALDATYERDQLWMYMKHLRKFRTSLENYMATGKVALDSLEKRKKGIKKIF